MTGRGNSSTVSLVVFSSTSVGHTCQVSTLHFFSIFSRTPFTLLTTATRHPGLHFKPSPGTVRAFTDIHSCNFLPESLSSAFWPSKATSSHSWKCSPSPLPVLLGFIQNKILASHEISVSSDTCLESGCTDKGTRCGVKLECCVVTGCWRGEQKWLWSLLLRRFYTARVSKVHIFFGAHVNRFEHSLFTQRRRSST